MLRRWRAATSAYPLLPATLLAAVASAHFCVGLAARELTLLESQDLEFAAELLRTFRLSADHSPLHFALLNAWLRLGGASVAFVRLPSALCAGIAAGFVFRLTERLGGAFAALAAGLLFALNPEIVEQARSLRLYAFGILCAAVCLERAHAFLGEKRGEFALFGFLAGAVLAVHTHLFLWLWVLPLAALVGFRIVTLPAGRERRRALVAAGVASVLVLSQVVHGATALSFTHDRHAIYTGLSTRADAFLGEVGRQLLLGAAAESVRLPGYLLVFAFALPALGLRRLDSRLRAGALLALVPPFAVALALSFGSEVEARYLCFALPGLAVLAGLGLTAVPLVLAAGAGLALAGLSLFATARAYGPPPSDWSLAAERLEHLKQPEDVVAVFPGYWAKTFRYYTRIPELVPVTYPVDLERVLARGRRVFLVINVGRSRGDLDAYLDAFTERHELFATQVRDVFEIDEVHWKAPLARAPDHVPAAVVFAGLVGSGGYAWSSERAGMRAFSRLDGLFGSADLAVAGYAPYEPPWPARLLLGPRMAARLAPEPAVADALAHAGVRTVVVSSEHGRGEAARSVLADARLGSVPSIEGDALPAPALYRVGDERVALVALGSERSAALSGDAARRVERFRAGLAPTDALVVFVPEPSSFDALPATSERELLHRLVDAGADVVIGQGGYAAMPVERYRNGVVAYSLGALLLPRTLDLVARESSGVALRVEFAAGRPVRFETLPVTFDDTEEPLLGRLDSVPPPMSGETNAFIANFGAAHASSTSPSSGVRPLALRAIAAPALETWVEREFRGWIPWASRGTSLAPFAATFGGGHSFAGVRGVRSLGVPRAAIEVDAAPGTEFALEFPPLLLGHSVEVSYALADDREQSKYIPWLDETVGVKVENGPEFSGALPFRSGWHTASLDTTPLAGSRRRVTLVLASPASHFPVAFDLRIEP
jgi:hypothetical protein